METFEQNERDKAEQRAGAPIKDPYCVPKDADWITRNGNRIVAIDIDGTITQDGRWLGEGYFHPVKPVVRARAGDFKEKGWIVVIYTVRKDKARIANWLDVQKIPYDYIETKPCYYTVLFDDRAVPFNGKWTPKHTLPAKTLPEEPEDPIVYGSRNEE